MARSKAGVMSRAEFVRRQPISLPIEAVIERGARAGIVIKSSDVSTARWKMRQDEQVLVKLPKRDEQKRDSTPPPADTPAVLALNKDGFLLPNLKATEKRAKTEEFTSIAAYWERFVLRIGTERARQIVDAVEAKYTKLG